MDLNSNSTGNYEIFGEILNPEGIADIKELKLILMSVNPLKILLKTYCFYKQNFLVLDKVQS